MSGDRCYVTVYPLKSLRHRTPRVAMIISICIWISEFSLVISPKLLPLFFSSKHWLNNCSEAVTPRLTNRILSKAGSFILSTPILIYQRIEEGYWYGPRQYCMERFPSKAHERVFILYQFIAAYLLPVLTISFCYTLMVKRVGQPSVEPVDNNYQVQAWYTFCHTIILLVKQIHSTSRKQLLKVPVKV